LCRVGWSVGGNLSLSSCWAADWVILRCWLAVPLYTRSFGMCPVISRYSLRSSCSSWPIKWNLWGSPNLPGNSRRAMLPSLQCWIASLNCCDLNALCAIAVFVFCVCMDAFRLLFFGNPPKPAFASFGTSKGFAKGSLGSKGLLGCLGACVFLFLG